MCGINGVFNFAGGEVDPGHVIAMNEMIAHRGPDDCGIWISDEAPLVFGHQRLSILDLSANGHQPMSLPDGTTIVFNGEIYNFRELRKLVPKFRFRTESDTETILALYQALGESCLSHLTGIFSFAIWDPARKGVFVARDRIGNKPLYYCNEGGRFAFSSEIRSLLVLPWVDRKVDEKALYYFLTFGFTPPPMTMFDGILKLEQGHSMWVHPDQPVSPKPYWRATLGELAVNEEEIKSELMQKLNRSIDLQMVSDVPVGLFLSGGVDSSAIAALVRERSDKEIHTFSISFPDQPDYDESTAARQMSERFGYQHHERVVTQEDLEAMIGEIVDVFDEPLADSTCIPIYFLCQMAKEENIKVVLTGDGPDELLLGYRSWLRHQKLYPHYRRLQKLPQFFRQLIHGVGRQFTRNDVTKDLLFRLSRKQELFWGNAPSFKESSKRSILSKQFVQRSLDWDCHDEIDTLRRAYDQFDHLSSYSDANWMSYIGLTFTIPNFYLHRADRLGMRHSIELRTPYLDHNFVDFCLSIPADVKVADGVPKHVLKKALENRLPASTLYAKKKGFLRAAS